MKLFETCESKERLRRAFSEIRASSSLPPSDLAKIYFDVPQWDDDCKVVRGLVRYLDSPYISEISVELLYSELMGSGVKSIAFAYEKALMKLEREIPKVKAAAKCLRRINKVPFRADRQILI